MHNHWLKKYKEAKNTVLKCRVFLFKVDTKNNLINLEGSEQNLAAEVEWSPNPHPYINAEGIAVKDGFGKIIWHQIFPYPITIVPGDVLSVKLNLRFDKWNLNTLLP